MQSLKQKKDSLQERGFTIIEVMIVLVIAAVIILIVFLAVPALQRNSRNNQRKNDAARVLSAVDEWRNNNGRNMPAGANTNAILTITGDLGFYDTIDIVGYQNSPGYDNFDESSAWVEDDRVNIVTSAQCDSQSSKSGSNGVIAIYTIETGNGLEVQCTGS